MRGLILAAVNPDNTPHGYNWTFAFPMLLFIVIALILYTAVQQAAPARAAAARSRPAPARSARGRARAGGVGWLAASSLAPGGGVTESRHEPAGAHLVAERRPG